MKPMRILLISPFFHPHKGGSQRYMEELYTHLRRAHRDVQVDVLAYNTDDAREKEVYRGLTIYRVPCWHILWGQFALAYPWALFALLWRLRKQAYTIVHAHLRFFDSTWWAWVYAKLIGARSVFTEHVAHHPVHPNDTVSLIVKAVDYTLGRWAIGHYDLVATTNTPAKDFLKNKLGVQKRIHITYGGVDTKVFHPKESARRTIPAVPKLFGPKDIIITYAGRMIWSKGVGYLYTVAKELLPTLPKHVYFVFAGPGPVEEELRSDITKEKFERRIFVTGSLNAQEVRKTLQASDIFVHPSHHAEGFPNSVLEAAASGCFVMATDNAGTKEIVEDKRTGLLIPQHTPQDLKRALLWAIRHPKERSVMAKAGRTFVVSRFEWGLLAEKFYRLLKQ